MYCLMFKLTKYQQDFNYIQINLHNLEPASTNYASFG